ncbi:hypothetical protein [Pseudomonas sp. PDM11]|uniref:hypothetical protein n=1 Tax=Pseudomonas sp. PDM11 TaxID=2769309 RepID=UPI00177DEC00|nr:hypothetical protein [Pseudomonas sp. PDM11]MBD9397451.1 hypothetical protein [Pseudomonas sp. PDM11]
MFKRSACYLLLVGLYALASAFLYLDGRSAFYLKDEELDYLVLLIAGAVLVVMPALALFLIGMARREPRRNPVIPGTGSSLRWHAGAWWCRRSLP